MVSKEGSIYIHRVSNIWLCTICTRDIFPFNSTEEYDELLEIIAEFQETDPLIPLNVLIDLNKIFTPFEINEDLNIPLIDSDPDVQFYNKQCNNSLHSCDFRDIVYRDRKTKFAKRQNIIIGVIYRPPDTDIT